MLNVSLLLVVCLFNVFAYQIPKKCTFRNMFCNNPILVLIDSRSLSCILLGCELDEKINPIMYAAKEWQYYLATPFYENVQHDALNLLQ